MYLNNKAIRILEEMDADEITNAETSDYDNDKNELDQEQDKKIKDLHIDNNLQGAAIGALGALGTYGYIKNTEEINKLKNKNKNNK